MNDRFRDTMQFVREVVQTAFVEYKADEATDQVAKYVTEVLNHHFNHPVDVRVVVADDKHKIAFFSADPLGLAEEKKLETIESVATWLLEGRVVLGG